MFYHNGRKFEIVAPKLSSFVLQDICPADVESFVLDFPALETVYVDARLGRSRKEEVLMVVPGILEHRPSPFCRLETLKVECKQNSLGAPQSVLNYFLGGSAREDKGTLMI
ncbi:hypothetical protein DITRI_Ditri07aG0163600 [Diplodiscus trichospermus]